MYVHMTGWCLVPCVRPSVERATDLAQKCYLIGRGTGEDVLFYVCAPQPNSRWKAVNV